ncbi:MAG: hypothetical protein M3297_05715 [Thermoproteota archaeon]|nr:hypothetical protein [Thermoproteota archaeon]
MKKIQQKVFLSEARALKQTQEQNRTEQNLKRTIQLRTARNTRICPTGSLIS